MSRWLSRWRGPRAGAAGWLLVGARFVVGAVLLYASIDKILHPRLFADAVAAYQLAPPEWVPWIAVVLPWIEAVTGALLWAGILVDGAAICAAGMLTVFVGGIASAMARGLEIDCGCFSVSHDSPVGPGRLLEDVALAAAAAWIAVDRIRAASKLRAAVPAPAPNDS